MARGWPAIPPGTQFGHWTVLHQSGSDPKYGRIYRVRGACGSETDRAAANLRQAAGRQVRCHGCPSREGRPRRQSTWVRCLTCAGLVADTPERREQHEVEVHDSVPVRFGAPMEDQDDSDEEDAA
jgi:hypothetical protein